MEWWNTPPRPSAGLHCDPPAALEIRQEATRDSWNRPAREGRGQINISEPGNDHAQSAMEFDTPPRTSMAARVLVPEKISVQRSALVAPPAKSLAPVNTSEFSTDPWGMPTRQSFNFQRSASVAPPAKSLAPVNTSALSTDPWGTPTRQSSYVQRSASVAPPANSLAPVNTSALSTDPWGTPTQQSSYVQRSASVAPSAKYLAPVNTSALSTDPWSTPTRQSSYVQRSALVAPPAKSLAPVNTSTLSLSTDPWGTPSVNVQFGPAFPEGHAIWAKCHFRSRRHVGAACQVSLARANE